MNALFKGGIAGLVLLAASAIAAPGLIPAGQQSTSLLYDRMARDRALTLNRFDYQLGPYPIDKFNLTGTPYSSWNELADYRLSLFSSLGENFSAARQSRPLAYEAIRGGLAFRPTKHLFVYGNFLLDEELANDPGYLGKKWRGLAGDVEHAFAHWQTERFDLTAGRFASFWGTQNSLVLGPNSPLDGFGYSYRWGRLTLSYRLARLDPLKRWVNDSSQVIENRYFAGHRLDIHLSKRLRVGLFETVVFGGEGRQIELYYLNPLIFFHGSQVNEGSNDNTFVGFDFSIKPFTGYHFYGQLMIDDMQVESKSQSDQEPNEIGFLIGGYLADLAPSLDLKMEYSRVTNWTFNQDLPRNRYLFKNNLISAAMGNDYDLTDVSLLRWFGELTVASLNFSYMRQGEGSVAAEWSEPWLNQDGSYDEPFPTGIVEKSMSLSVGLKGYLRSVAAYDIEAGFNRITNFGHIESDDRTIPFLKLSLSATFSTILDAR
ncbi:MAG: hypothetical protein IPH75_07100 [bacterium]|nr:hypothetical protein [bacterium]